MDKDEIQTILDKHKLWLENKPGGVRANFGHTYLRRADLKYADLRYANFRYANLRYVDFGHADLRYVDFGYADLKYVDFGYADLRYVNLRNTNILTFQFNQHLAICTGERLTIGCKDMCLAEWICEYEHIGKYNRYTDLEIEMYGQFIKNCIEIAGRTS